MIIRFMSQKEAEKIEPIDTMGLISISDGEDNVDFINKWTWKLPLQFDDIDVEIADYVLFSNDHANRILNFIERLPDTINVIVVHCYAGISRSAAVAKFLSEYYQSADFPSRYELYNKKVYSTLKTVWFQKVFVEEVNNKK